MILKLIFHFEWHRGYNHNLPRISIRRAPYPGQVVYDKGWGWRRLVMCDSCSGVGYFDAPLSEIERRSLSKGPYYSTEQMLAEVEQNHPADGLELDGPFPAPSSPLTAQDEETGSVYQYMPAPALQDRWGRYPDEEHYECPHSPVHDRQCRPVPEEGNGDRWENEGGSYRG